MIACRGKIALLPNQCILLKAITQLFPSRNVSCLPWLDRIGNDFCSRLKYLYLMFLAEDPIKLDKWVFNTEAHAFPVFDWTEEDRVRFNL